MVIDEMANYLHDDQDAQMKRIKRRTRQAELRAVLTFRGFLDD